MSSTFAQGGEDTPKGRFPHFCSLRQRDIDEHFCGCALVHKNFVLTAAHCVDPEQADSVTNPLIYVGIAQRDNGDDSAEANILSLQTY